jgi:hypothetical protein
MQANQMITQGAKSICRISSALTTFSLVFLVSVLPPFEPFLNARAQQAQPLTKEQWLTAWLQHSPKARDVSGQLVLFRFKDPMYVLQKEISWIPNAAQASQFKRVDVPVGFVTDLASIPRIFWSLLRPDGEYAYAAIVHDYLYWTQTTTRDIADLTLKHGMEDFGIDSMTIATIYNAVRVGGAGAWTENGQLRANGEKRILIKLPDDPRVTWEDWKKHKDVFAP